MALPESEPLKTFNQPGGAGPGGEEATMPYAPDAAPSPGESSLEQARRRNERSLMAIDGVTGVGLGRTPTGDDAIVVYLRHAAARKRLPATVEGYPVVVEVTGEIDAYGRRADPLN